MEADVRLLADDATKFRRASSPARMTLAPRVQANVSALLRHMDAAAPCVGGSDSEKAPAAPGAHALLHRGCGKSAAGAL